ncbi:MAG: hypothetical protein HKM23_08580 [Nitrosopumilus sp.]|nr:hypothetical protein [Nitrosopumilus sp.]NNL58534.1 hypothetical protein [Nitrosopumilus sp.]
MDQNTRKLIEKFSPMWTNKQIWEFEQINKDLKFDLVYTEPEKFDSKSWKTKLAYPDSNIRDVAVRTFDYLLQGNQLWIASKDGGQIDAKLIPYLMATIADIMIEEEICLNFRLEHGCLGILLDNKADLIDCKEFFEEFYHLATGFNYDIDTGIPNDETEAEIYLTRLQEEFDEKMKLQLGDRYLPGNNDPKTFHQNDN